MKQAILFDMDGVLIDSETVYARCMSRAFAGLGFNIPETEFYRFAGIEYKRKFETVIKERNLSVEVQELYKRYFAAQKEFLQDFAPLLKKDAPAVLRHLRETGYILALCSNSNQERIEKVFHDTGLAGIFDLVVTGDSVPRRKPDPGVYLSALKTLALPAENCLAVEDSVYGIQAAKSAGLTVAALLDERFPYIEGTADFTMHGWTELNRILEELQ